MGRRHFGTAALSLFGALAAGESALSTHTPCPDCPPGVGPAPVEVTAQFQELELCSATTGTTVVYPTATDAAVEEIETIGYACAEEKSTFISTTILAAATDGSYTSTVVTDVDQIITISYSSTTVTSTVHTTTFVEATSTAQSSDLAVESALPALDARGLTYPIVREVLVYDIVEYIYTSPFREIGSHAIPKYGGSGLCPYEKCGTDSKGCDFQPVFAKECHNSNCVVYDCTWKYVPKRRYFGGKPGWHREVQAPAYEVLPAFPRAPAGCEVVKAYYYDFEDGHFISRSSCYTVPVIIGFPPQYPPGSCRNCVLPPGWTTTIIVVLSPTPTTVTLTVPTTVTIPATVTATATVPATVTATATSVVTTTAVPEVPSGPLTCPASDRTVFSTGEGSTFLVECDVGFSGTEIFARSNDVKPRDILNGRDIGTTSSFENCIELCDRTNSCVAVVFYPMSGRCRGYSSVTGTARSDGGWAATLIRKGPGFSTSSTPSTSGPTPTTTPGASATPSGASSTDPAVTPTVTSTAMPSVSASEDPATASTDSVSDPAASSTDSTASMASTVDPVDDSTTSTDSTADPTTTATDSTIDPTDSSSTEPAVDPTVSSSTEPTVEPTTDVTTDSTAEPTVTPTDTTAEPTDDATTESTADPTDDSTTEPTVTPTDTTADPTDDATTDSTADPTDESTTEATATASETTASTPEPSNGGTINTDNFATSNAGTTTVNGVSGFAMSPPEGGTASVSGDAALPQGVQADDQVSVSVDTIVDISSPNNKRSVAGRSLFPRVAAPGLDTGCSLQINAGGQTIYNQPLLTTGGQVLTVTSTSTVVASNPMSIQIIQVCGPGSTASLTIFNIGVKTEVRASSTSTTASSTAPPTSTPQPTSTEPSATPEPTETAAESTEASAEPTSSPPISPTPSSTTATATPDPSADADPDMIEREVQPELVPKRAVDARQAPGNKVRRRGGRIVGAKEIGKKAKRSIPIRL